MHLESGKPVGSAYIARHCDLGLSPASIRAVMNDLESEGFLCHPHTSAGRVPTVKSYRYYVRHLMPEMALPKDDLLAVKKLALDAVREHDAELFMGHVAAALSEATDLIGVVLAPTFDRGIFDRIEIINLTGPRFLFFITLMGGAVNTLNLTVDDITPRWKVEETARIISERLHGLTIADIKKTITRRLYNVGGDRTMIEAVLASSDRIFGFPSGRNVHISGLSRALSLPDCTSGEYTRRFADLVEHTDSLELALSGSIEDTDVSVHIGDHVLGTRPPLCLVAGRFHGTDGEGVIGIIGPARVYYPRLTAVVRHTVPIAANYFAS